MVDYFSQGGFSRADTKCYSEGNLLRELVLLEFLVTCSMALLANVLYSARLMAGDQDEVIKTSAV